MFSTLIRAVLFRLIVAAMPSGADLPSARCRARMRWESAGRRSLIARWFIKH